MGRKKAGEPAPEQTPDEVLVELAELVWTMVCHHLSFGVPCVWIEDLVQDVLIELLLRFRGGDVRNPRGYLYSVVRGECANFLSEKRDRHGFRFERDNVEALEVSRDKSIKGDVAISTYDLEDELEYLLRIQELCQDLRIALAGEVYSELWRYKAEGLTYAEIGEKAGMTPDQARGRITRSRPRIRRKLRRLGYDARGKKRKKTMQSSPVSGLI